jgi:hypothetical protein
MNETETDADSPIQQIKDWPTYFEQIRRRPGMWLGQASLTALDNQIGGIELAERIHDVPRNMRLGGFPWSDFEKWADERFNPNRLSIRSFSMALRITNSESEAFELWFQWYDQFNKEQALP